MSKRRAILAPNVPYITARARCARRVCQLPPGPEDASASNRNKEELTPEKRDMPSDCESDKWRAPPRGDRQREARKPAFGFLQNKKPPQK